MVQESRCLAAGARRLFGGSAWLVAVVAAVGAVGCNRSDEGLTRQVLEANDKVLACQKELAETKGEVKNLKHQLAQALAYPSRIELKDPELIELVASIRSSAPVADSDVQPTLDTRKASEVVMQGSRAMQMCYERALKKNAVLQTKAGIRFKLGVTVKPTGSVEDVEVDPSVDKGLTDCIRTTAMHWKFPSFQGKAVTIEQPFTLTPKT
jgi:hypothetical protein